MSPRTIVVNESFRAQRTTGQQRYAREIADRLLVQPDVVSSSPVDRIAESTIGTWLWTLSALPVSTANSVLLSLTSRSPVVHPHHVVVVHDLFVLTHPEWYSSKYVLSHAPLLKANLRTARAIVAVSEPVAEEVRASGLTNAPVSVAPNAPSPVFAAADAADAAESVLERIGVTSGRFLLAVGSLDPRKNLPRLAAAYALLSPAVRAEFPLVVIGGGSAIFGSFEATWPEETIVPGYVSDEELAALYRHATGVVFPSLAEGFGLPIVEAAVAGAQLAVSDIEVFRWIAGDHVEYLNPRSPDSIADAMLVLIEGDGDRFDEAARAAIASRFSWDTSAGVVLDVCRSVASR